MLSELKFNEPMAYNDFHIEIDLLRHESSLEDLQDDGSEGGLSVAIMRYHRALERERLEREHAETVELLRKAQRAYNKWFAESIQPPLSEAGPPPPIEEQEQQTKPGSPESRPESKSNRAPAPVEEQVQQQKPDSSKSRPEPKEHAIDDLEGYSDEVELLLQAKEHSQQFFSPCSADSIPSCSSLLKEDSFLQRFYKKKGHGVAREGQKSVYHTSKISKCIQTDEQAGSSNHSVCSSTSMRSDSEIWSNVNRHQDVRKPYTEGKKLSYNYFQGLIREITVPTNVTSVAIQAKAEVCNQSTQTETVREERQGETLPHILSATDISSDCLRYIMAAQSFYNPQILQRIYGNNWPAYPLGSAPLPLMPNLYYPGADRSSLTASVSLEHTRLRDPGSLLHGSTDPYPRNDVPPLESDAQDEDIVQGSRSVIYCAASKGGLFQGDIGTDNKLPDYRNGAEPQISETTPELALSSAVELCARRVLNLSSGCQRADSSQDNSPNGNVSLQVNLSDTYLSKTPDLTQSRVEFSLDAIHDEGETQVESISDKDIRISCIYHDLSTIEEADSEFTNSYGRASDHLDSSRKHDLLNPKVSQPYQIDSFRDIVADFETFEESKKRSDQAVESELKRLSAEAEHSSEKLNKVDAKEFVFEDKVGVAKNNLDHQKSKSGRAKSSQSQILDTQHSSSVSKRLKGRLVDRNSVRQQKFRRHRFDTAISSSGLHDNGSEAIDISLNSSAETSARSTQSKNILIDEANKMMETSPEITLSVGTSSSFGSHAPLTIITIPQMQANSRISCGENISHKNSQVSNNSSEGFQPLTLRISPHTLDASFSRLSPRYSIIPKLSPSQDRIVSLTLQSSSEQSCCVTELSSESGTKSSSSTESFKPLTPVFYSGESCCGLEQDNDQAKSSSSDESFHHLKRNSELSVEASADSPSTPSFTLKPPVPRAAAAAKKGLHITTSEENLSVVFSGLKGLHQSTPIRCSSECSERSGVPDSLSLLRSRSDISIKPACSSASSGSLSERTAVRETDNEGSTEGSETKFTKSVESVLQHELSSKSESEGDG